MEPPKRSPQFILLGDSLIQYTSYLSNGGYQFGAGLAEQCIRRFDVVNKGLSGYNTSQILKILQYLIPPPSCGKVEFLLILLGTNDSCLPTSPTGQHIPLGEYRENIKKILTHASVTAHNPTILLVTPPPINECHLEAEDFKKGYSAVTRHQSVTAEYAEAVRQIVMDFEGPKVLLVDLWAAMMKEAARLSPGYIEGRALLGSKEKGDSPGLRCLLADGLHLTGQAYALFLKEVMLLLGNSLEEAHINAQPHWSTASKID